MLLRVMLLVAIFALAACGGGSDNPPVLPRDVSSGTGHREAPMASATAASKPSVVIESSAKGAVISNLILGTNMGPWYDITQSGLSSAFKTADMTEAHWPGGSFADVYHWQTNTACNGAYTSPHSTFDNFMKDVAEPAGLDVAITLNYGSNSSCNGGGDPSEAAAWVSHAKAENYKIKYWTVGNEEDGSWEYDLHSPAHNPTTYANAVATGYYPAIKAANPNAQVGVIATTLSSWDKTVLSEAKYDYVELHYYYYGPGKESDSELLASGPAALTSVINTLKSELASAGHANTPIYVGEMGSVYNNPGKQSMSIVSALYGGMLLGELMNDGNIAGADWYIGFGSCETTGNMSSSLYGWQNFGGYMMFSDGIPNDDCKNVPTIARGTAMPVAMAYHQMAKLAVNGEHVVGVNVNALPNVRAYAATHEGGYAVALFNLSGTTSYTIPLAVSGLISGSKEITVTYDKALYDNSKQNVWSTPTWTSSTSWKGPVTVTLPPWSITDVILWP